MSENNTRQLCFVVRINHFDPIWRRCWDRPFQESGRQFVSYRAIEQAWLDDEIDVCTRDGGSFCVETVWVLRHYLERRSERLDTLRKLAREGRFELLGAGENILDANMVHGELLARNLMLGTLWAQETLGVRPTTGCHTDGFGSSAQMPQIFRDCGYEWLPSVSYVAPDAPYWRGLDGSIVLVLPDGRFDFSWNSTNGFAKLKPCPACNGRGCNECSGRGFEQGIRAEFNPPQRKSAGTIAVLIAGGEEILPGRHVAEDIAAFNAKSKDFIVRLGTYSHLREFVANELAAVDNPPRHQVSTKTENNPSSTGCYVTRIKIKQQHRLAEHMLLAAECWDTLLAGGAQAEALRGLWRRMTLSGFHDAITCSHIDPAYDELLDLLSDVQSGARRITASACSGRLAAKPNTFTLFNHQSFAAAMPVVVHVPGKWSGAAAKIAGRAVPVYDVEPDGNETAVRLLADVPPLGAAVVELSEAPPQVQPLDAREIRCGTFNVKLGDNGITGLEVDGIGRVIDSSKFLLGEPILENDVGDPWTTRSLDRTRLRLGQFTRLESVERRGNSVAITLAGHHRSSDNSFTAPDPCVTLLAWRQVFRLMEGVPWIELDTRVEWYTHNRRLRLAFPSKTDHSHGVYDIPYGVIERDRYEPVVTWGNSAGGDWPTVHWAAIQAPAHTFAVFNCGTPSYRIENGSITVSVLRSPQLPHCLVEPYWYITQNHHGMSDYGVHNFRHAICIAEGNWQDNGIGRLGALFNSGLTVLPGELSSPLPAWKLDAQHTQITAVKKSEDGKGVVLRLVELSGKPEAARLSAPAGYSAEKVGLLEDHRQDIPRSGGGFKIDMQPWKIVSVKMTAG